MFHVMFDVCVIFVLCLFLLSCFVYLSCLRYVLFGLFLEVVMLMASRGYRIKMRTSGGCKREHG